MKNYWRNGNILLINDTKYYFSLLQDTSFRLILNPWISKRFRHDKQDQLGQTRSNSSHSD